MPHSHRRMVYTFLVVLACTVAPASAQRDHDVVPDDYFTIGVISACAVSPDGVRIAYVETRWEKEENGRNADIWIVERSSLQRRRITFDHAGDSHPQWSQDGEWIYFQSARKTEGTDKPPYDGTLQVWRIRPDGGQLQPVTRVADGIGAYALSAASESIFYTVGHEVVDDAWKDLRSEYDELSYGHGVTEFNQIWKLDLQSWRSEKVVDENRVIGEFAVAPDESRIAMLTTPTGELITNEGWSRVDVFDCATRSVTSPDDRLWRADGPSPYGWLEGLAWAGDSRALAFGVSYDGYQSEVFVAEFGETAPTVQKLTRQDEITLIPDSSMTWRPDSRSLLIRGEWQARAPVYEIQDIADGAQGATTCVTPGDICADAFATIPGDRALAVVMSGLTHPPDLFKIAMAGPEVSYDRLTRVNPQVDTWKLPQMSLVRWQSPDGTEVEGILELPSDHDGKAPLPMIVELHGGPTAASLFRMRLWIYGRVLMPAQGYALLSPNYRGSTGYGDRFLTELVGHKNDRDVADILAGVDAMVERGVADPDRLGVMGWSNGGYLTNCLITKTDRFKAASSGAGVLDVVMQWETEDTPGHVINFQNGLPWSVPEQMRKASPLYDLDKVTTPTLIHIGENDPRCPPGHSKALYRALHTYLKVPTELIVYPGEGHGLTRYKHRKAKMEWDLRWFDRYLKPASETPEKPQLNDA